MRGYVLLVGALLACEAEAPHSASTGAGAGGGVPVAADEVPVAADTTSPHQPVAGGTTPPPRPRVVDTAPSPPPQVDSWLQRYDFDERLWHVDLPGRLDEVSGLAFNSAGRLFAHDDEIGRVHELDPETGAVTRRFDLGPSALRDDLEGIAIAGERFFLVSSTGILYEFREGQDREDVDFRTTDTGVGSMCEVEGLDVLDGVELLVACKTTAPERGYMELLRLPLDGSAQGEPIRLDRAALGPTDIDDDFAPSAVAVTPSGSIAILSGRHEAIIEIDRAGRLLHAVALRRGRHPQSEGIAFGQDGTLYIADERNGQDARLTAYAPRSGEGGA